VKAIKLRRGWPHCALPCEKNLRRTLSQYSDAELQRFIDLRQVTNDLLKRAIDLQDDKRVRAFVDKRKQ